MGTQNVSGKQHMDDQPANRQNDELREQNEHEHTSGPLSALPSVLPSVTGSDTTTGQEISDRSTEGQKRTKQNVANRHAVNREPIHRSTQAPRCGGVQASTTDTEPTDRQASPLERIVEHVGEKLTKVVEILSRQADAICDRAQELRLRRSVLSFEDACAYLDLSESHLYRLTSDGIVPHSKPNGKKLYFRREELDAWMMSKPIKTQEEIEQEVADYCATYSAYRRPAARQASHGRRASSQGRHGRSASDRRRDRHG